MTLQEKPADTLDDKIQKRKRIDLRQLGLLYKKHKKVTIPLSVAIVLLVTSTVVLAIPSSRYAVLSQFVKKSYSVYVLDLETNSPLSDVEIALSGQTIKTDNNGHARFEGLSVGYHTLAVSKTLYDARQVAITVPVLKKSISEVKLKANGKQVAVVVTDKIDGTPIEGVKLTANDSSAETNKDGNATVVIPIGSEPITARVEKDGYVSTTTTLTQDGSAKATLVKAGRIYFLSKQSGTVDVISTNLDGSDRQTIVKGTGNEYDQSTFLLASRDWKYLALSAKRDTDDQALYIIDTSNTEQLSRITDGKLSLTLVGWSGERFIYKENNPNDYQGDWKLLSVSGQSKKVTILEKSERVETQYGYTSDQSIDTPYILDGNTIVYATTWSGGGPYQPRPQDRLAGVIAMQADGSNRRFIKQYPATEIGRIETKLYKPQEVHYRVFDPNGDRRENIMTIDKKIEIVPPEQQKFDQSYPTFLMSPDGQKSFWAESRDGKNTLFVGDGNSGNSQQLASLSEYKAYGWFTDDYILVQKNNSELFITTPDRLKANSEPLKISDYHKPDQSFSGYGYGYGGQ